MTRRASRSARESPYAKFVKLNHLDALGTPGWSGQGSHVEFHSQADVPLRLGPNLGQGSFSVVQKVIRTNADTRPLAQKIIWDYRKGGIEQVMTEVQCIQYLRHQHIVQLVGTYVVQRTLHILLFPVGQWNLRHFLQEFEDERMASKAYPDFYSVGTFFKCLATGVAYLHDEADPHIINLDIKPENIIVRRCADRRLTVFITDFGVSRSFQPSSPSTDANTLYTTPIYQAPEIAKKKEYGRRADIFSLGCVFSEMTSILAGKTLQVYSKYREHYLPGLVHPSIAFESNLPACVAWLEELKTLPPFKRPSTGRNPEWWTRLLQLIEKMISEDPSERHTSEEVVKAFPQGPCCKVQLEEYESLQQCQQTLLTPHAPAENSSIDIPSPALTSSTTPISATTSEIDFSGSSLLQDPACTVSAFHEVALAPRPEPEIAMLTESSESDSSLSNFDWSGNGAHMQYASKSMVPLELVSFLGMGTASSVHKVKTKHQGSHVFAQKILQTGRQTLRMEQMIREAKLLQTLRNPHIVRLIGTAYDQRYFSILTYPAAEWNLSDFMSELEEGRGSRDALTIERKQALHSFTACLINALQYLHRVEIKHKDVKPSNILVQRWSPHAAGYHVYLSDFGISTKIERDDNNNTEDTTGPTSYTPKYASPETLMRESRNTKSDVFSMGCVWVEMYTIIIGERLSSLTEHLKYSDDMADEDSIEDGPKTPVWEHEEKEDLSHSWRCTYAGGLNVTVRWLHRLRIWLDTHASLMAGGSSNFSALDIPTEQLANRLDYIESMIKLKPADRPSAAQLCIWLGSNECCTASTTPYDHEVLSTPPSTDESSGSRSRTSSAEPKSGAATREPAKEKIPPTFAKEKWSASVPSGSMAHEHISMSPTQSTHSADEGQIQASKPVRARPVRRISVVGKWMTSHLRRASSTGTSGSSSKVREGWEGESL